MTASSFVLRTYVPALAYLRITGSTTTTVPVAGSAVAGFDRSLSRAVVVANGAPGSVPESTTVRAGPIGGRLGVVATFGSDLVSPPALSPSGNEFVAGVMPEGSSDIGPLAPDPLSEGLWRFDLPSGGRHLLAAGTILDAAWSPDGHTIAYVGTPASGGRTVVVATVAATGGAPRVLATLPADTIGAARVDEGPSTALSWSGLGLAVSFETGDLAAPNTATSTVEVIPAAGGTPRTVFGPAAATVSAVAWSPTRDGRLAISVVTYPGSPAASTSGGVSATTGVDSQPGDGPVTTVEVLDPSGGAAPVTAATEPGDGALVTWAA